VLVEHLDVVARVLLGREGVHLAADGVDSLGDILGTSARGAFEEHVLDEMRDAALLLRLVSRAACEPHPDAHGSHVRHSLGEEPKSVGQHVTNDHWLSHRTAQG
jgi:hypothetical protein